MNIEGVCLIALKDTLGVGRNMQIEDFVWMVRDFRERPSALHISAQHLFVGGWDGCLTCWDIEGAKKWTITLPDRVQEIEYSDDHVYVASGLFVVCITADAGDILWEVETEGSADALVIDSKNDTVLATSSVYDIEYGDFMESACWRISCDTGKILQCVKFDERPWALSLEDGNAILGLGRPRGGVLEIGDDKMWHDLNVDSPVTCGNRKGEVRLYGHANGSVTKWDGKNSELLITRDKAIDFIRVSSAGTLLALESGTVELFASKGDIKWAQHFGNPIQEIQAGFQINNSETIWIQHRKTVGGCTIICDIKSGEIITSFELKSSPTALVCFEDYSALSLEDGTIYFFERGVFQNRIENGQNESSQGGESHRSQMLSKLRKLRDN